MIPSIIPIKDNRATLELAGGKGMSLARLAQAGFPVPDGFIVTTAAYRQFIQVNDLQPKILAALKGVDAALPSSGEPVSAKIRDLFKNAQIPADICETVTVNYEEVCKRYHPREFLAPVAVRSSATAEDLPGASFAGQQETFLNILGHRELLDAVRDCWASLWTARAISYRARQDIDPESVGLAVVVQELIPAESAGIAFSVNPVNGNRDEVVINAAWGLGEAVVGGQVTPDTITIHKPSGRILQREIAEKTVMTVLSRTGTQEQPVPDFLKTKEVLTGSQATELAHFCVRIEKMYQVPVDIEWALADGKFWILQARPVTTIPRPRVEWKNPHPKSMLARGSFAEFLPDPISPLFATLAVPLARDASIEMLFNYTGLTVSDSYLFAIVNGYLFVGMKTTPTVIWQFIKVTILHSKKILSQGKVRWLESREKYQDTIKKWQSFDMKNLSSRDLVTALREIFAETAVCYTVLQSGVIPAASFSELIFSNFYNRFVRQKGDPESTVFLLGLENKALQAEKALFDLAIQAKKEAELDRYFGKTSAEEISLAFQSGSSELLASSGFSAGLNSYLVEFGHSIYDLDFAKPVPAGDPTPLIEAIKVYINGGGSNPYERQNMAKHHRELAMNTILERSGSIRKKWFLKLLRWAQDSAPLREDGISDMGLGYPRLKELAGELGSRFAAQGVCNSAEDIYWLEAREVDELAERLDLGNRLTDFTDVIEQRKKRYQAAKTLLPPMTIPEKNWMSKLLVHDNPAGSNVLKGLGASAGKVTAKACVLLGPEDFHQLEKGDVLVAVTTTPAWTPLFALASAVVTDIGGPLSHSSIVAREYGIPAVLATGAASRLIRSGQMVSVDGSAGTVELL